VGTHASATGGSSSAYGQISRASGVGSAAIGYASRSTGANSVALGRSSSAGGANNNGGTTAIGYGAQAGIGAAGQTNATAIGASAKANAADSSAFGVGSSASGDSSLALGSGAQATAQNAVAIGNGSVANVANVVSVGAVGSNRRISHVAGAVDPDDAVNLKQVQSLIASASVRASSSPNGGVIRGQKKAATSTERFIAGDGSSASARNDRHASLNGGDVVRSPGRHSTRAAAPVAPVSCEFDGSKMTTAAGEQSTASPAFAPVLHSGISFQQGGSAAGCVTLSLSAEAMAPGSSIMEVRAVLDGSVEASPGRVFFAQEDEALHMRGFNFLFANIAPGPHRLEIQFRNAGDEGFVRFGQRTIMVQFAR
jgi:hypothetical protein